MCAQTRPRFMLSSQIDFGECHVNSNGKIPSTGKKVSSEEDRTHEAAPSRTASPTHYQLAILAPICSDNVVCAATPPTDLRPHTNATFATEIVSPKSVSTAISDAATIERTAQPGCTPMIKLIKLFDEGHTYVLPH